MSVLTNLEKHSIRSGQAHLEVGMVFGQSTVTSAAAANPMKMLTPVARGQSVWAYTSSFGGGLVAGDQTQLEINLRSGTRCFFGTQSSTKVYRNSAQKPCSHTTRAKLEGESLLIFAPEPMQAFAQSHYAQHQEFHLQSGAGLVLLDWFTAGRAARGERWAFSHFESRNDIFLDGERVLVDPILLTSAVAPKHMGRFNCLATLLIMGHSLKPQAEQILATVASMPIAKRSGEALSASPIRDGVLLRIAGTEVETVRGLLHHHLEFTAGLLGDAPWARKW